MSDHGTTLNMEYKSSKIYTPVSLFRPICPASCLPPLTLQSAILNCLLCLELSMLSLSLECHSSPSHPPAPICPANICSYFRSQLNLSILCKASSVVPPSLTLGRTDYFSLGAPSPHIYCQCQFASLGR